MRINNISSIFSDAIRSSSNARIHTANSIRQSPFAAKWSQKFSQFNSANLTRLAQGNSNINRAAIFTKNNLLTLKAQILSSIRSGLMPLSIQVRNNLANLRKNGFHYHEIMSNYRQSSFQNDINSHPFQQIPSSAWRDSLGRQWTPFYNPHTGQSASYTNWSPPNLRGIQERLLLDHHTGTIWHGAFNAHTGSHTYNTDFTPIDQHNMQWRSIIDCNTKTTWHESINHTTGERMLLRATLDRTSGKFVFERFEHPYNTKRPQQESSSPSKTENATPPSPQSIPPLVKNTLQKWGLPSNATFEDVRKVYKKLSLIKHPDKQSDRSKASIKKADQEFQELADDYELLENHFGQ